MEALKDATSGTEVIENDIKKEDINEFLNAIKKAGINFAKAAFLCVISPVALIIFLGLDEMYPKKNLDISGLAIGLAVLSILVTVAVAIFVFNKILLQKYEYIYQGDFALDKETENSIMEQKAEYKKTYIADMVTGAFICIIAIIPAAVCIIMDKKNLILFSVVALLIIAAFGIYRFVKAGITFRGYNKLLRN